MESENADTVPQTLEECLIHARLLADLYCHPDFSNWAGEQDTRMARSLLAGLEPWPGRRSHECAGEYQQDSAGAE